jgi:hypothetical protein
MELVDREHAGDTLDRLVASIRAGESRALVVSGDAGVGKTALLDYLAGNASGCRVVRTVGYQSEIELAFAALHQLCVPLLEGLTRLPAPQRDALRIAFGMGPGPTPDRFLVALAVLNLLSDAAEPQPLLCVVDDEQWLDRASAQVLGFVARRLVAESVGMVFAARVPSSDIAGLSDLTVEGLPEADARALLDSALSGPLDTRVRDQVADIVAEHVWDEDRWQLFTHRHVQLARDVGALSELPVALTARAFVLLFTGELAEAAALVQELQAAMEGTGTTLAPYAGISLEAFRGRQSETAALVEATIEDVSLRGEGNGIAVAQWATAVLNNAVGDYQTAMTAAQSASDHPGEIVSPTWALVELIEAAARIGESETAAEALRRLEAVTTASGTNWALGVEARSRALLSDDDAVERLYCESIERLGRTQIRADLARAHLLYGEWLRRQRRRVDARTASRRPRDAGFDGHGCFRRAGKA